MRRRSLLLSGLATLSAPAVAAAPSLLRFVPQADLAVLDPIWTTAYITALHGSAIFDTLYGMDAAYLPQPQMVAGHTVEAGGRDWRLTLRDGLRFHDGEPVLGGDVVASLRRWAAHDGLGAALMAATDSLEAVSDRVVRFRLKHAFALPDALGKAGAPRAFIMPARLVEAAASRPLTEMIGSGPFRFKADEWRQGDRVVYERFPGYVPRSDGAVSFMAGPRIARFDRLEWRIIPDAATASAALLAGEVDWWERPTSDVLPLLARSSLVATKILDPSGAVQFLRFNHLHPPFDNPAVRRALVGAISQTDTMQAAAGTDPALWSDCCGAFTPGSPVATEAGLDAMTSTRDMEKVRRDLATAGYRGERAVFLSVGDVPELSAISAVTADALRRAGLNLDEQVLDWGTVVQRRGSKAPVDQGGWSIMHSGFAGTDMMTPALNVPLRANGQQAWFGWPDIPSLESLRDVWFAAADLPEQRALCARIQEVFWREVPFIPLGLVRRPTAYRRDLQAIADGGVVFTGVHRA